ncbi:MAG: aldolase/citrate lyase family protein [Ramlibacter sp.]|uniref:HpcH/HpaI aldolase family protein n=1 Tax=Ramlibacter sp. TaxID=1917967 RepID=UPI00262824A3|nr:aldolase/citrate lyase family protein [Ramlibacter sp.]MDH4376216.1 aldolase/citrate lyase family protein [Ramlibacter sp.]
MQATSSPLGPAPAPGMPLDTRLRPALRGTGSLHGLFCGLPSPAMVEMAAFAGFDFVVIDNEHGTASIETTEHLLRAARATGIVPIVRCFEADIARTLDAGASGVKVPMVNTPEHAQRLAERMRYPRPAGQPGLRGWRGSAFSTRAAGYGAFGGPAHTDRSNESLALIVMIETPEAVECAHEIAAVEGVDAVFIGPNDLSHTMGHENRWQEAPVQRAIERAVRAVADAGKCAGVLTLDEEARQRYAGWGARYFANVASSLVMRAFEQAAGRGGALRY